MLYNPLSSDCDIFSMLYPSSPQGRPVENESGLHFTKERTTYNQINEYL